MCFFVIAVAPLLVSTVLSKYDGGTLQHTYITRYPLCIRFLCLPYKQKVANISQQSFIHHAGIHSVCIHMEKVRLSTRIDGTQIYRYDASHKVIINFIFLPGLPPISLQMARSIVPHPPNIQSVSVSHTNYDASYMGKSEKTLGATSVINHYDWVQCMIVLVIRCM